jgi:beta-mannosidase
MKIITVIILFLFSAIISCNAMDKNVSRTDINSGWEFSRDGENKWLKAAVPGCVHTDLLNNKQIDDPFFGINEKKLQWIGYADWIYKTTFNVSDEVFTRHNIELVFKGLDTYAEVILNDKLILTADNMFREWRIDCKELLKKSGNTLVIKFNNTFDVNLPKWLNAPYRLMAFPNNDQADTMVALYSRKAQFHYGWDWGPRLVTYGIWRPVYIEAWDNFKINDIHVIQENVSEKSADIISALEISSDREQSVTIDVNAGDKSFSFPNQALKAGVNKINVRFTLEGPRLWWSNGLGEPYLYKFNYKVIGGDASDEQTVNTGIRSLEVVRENDANGKSLYIKLNGVPVFMKGANYIPQDNFQDRVTPEKYEYIIKSAADANMNMLRVWGGGIFQDDAFYGLCDKYGILLWHDMLFACAMYPGDEAFLENVRHEVIDNIKRLRNHASIALYCGNNENEAAWYSWGWKELFNDEQRADYEKNMKKLFYDVIPKAIKEADDTRYYHPTSPAAGMNNVPGSEGDTHYWGVWHGKEPFSNYKNRISRFVSEYGFQSYPEMSTIKKFTAESERELHSEVMLAHQRCMADDRRDKEYGNRLIKDYMDRQFREPKDFESYVYVSQVLQAEGMKTAIEAHRKNMPYCMGSLYWQIDDCWPVASWSSIDYYGSWKAAHYYARTAFEKIHIIPEVKNDNVEIYIVSDSLNKAGLQFEIISMAFSGGKNYSETTDITVEPNAGKLYYSVDRKKLLNNSDESKAVTVCRLKSGTRVISQNLLYFREPKNLELEKIKIVPTIKPSEGGYDITVRSSLLAKNVYMTLEDGSSFFADNYFDLLPGEVKTVHVKTGKSMDEVQKLLKIITLADSY